MLSELATVPSDEILQFWYFKQIEKLRPLAEDVAHYKRAKYPTHKGQNIVFNGSGMQHAVTCK